MALDASPCGAGLTFTLYLGLCLRFFLWIQHDSLEIRTTIKDNKPTDFDLRDSGGHNSIADMSTI